jgi:hypothetical protein
MAVLAIVSVSFYPASPGPRRCYASDRYVALVVQALIEPSYNWRIPKLEAILFANRDEFEEIIGPGVGGVFVPRVGRDGCWSSPATTNGRAP